MAKTKYISFLDDDNAITPDHFKTLLEKLKSGNYDMVHCQRIMVFPNGKLYEGILNFNSENSVI